LLSFHRGMSTETKKKHVVILGAGASATSGYALANRLRLLMSSEQMLRTELSKRGNFKKDELDNIIKEVMRGPNKKAVELFRHGGFATVDEFSYLASEKFPTEVQSLKRLLRFVLALHDPEEEFQKSDYCVFIQTFFTKDFFRFAMILRF
jgi:hypothetical protein